MVRALSRVERSAGAAPSALFTKSADEPVQDDRNEEGQRHDPVQFVLKHTGKECGQNPRCDVTPKPGKSMAKSGQPGTVPGLGDVDADQLEEIVADIGVAELTDLVRIQLHVHDAEQTTFVVHDWKGQKAVLGSTVRKIYGQGTWLMSSAS
jgi:hypothetical protein